MEWFVKTSNTTGGPVDVWAVDGVDEKDLVESPEGHSYLPRPIAAHLLTLWRIATCSKATLFRVSATSGSTS